MGSSTSLRAACTVRSRAVAIPSRRSLPPALGIIRSRTGRGWNRRALRSSRNSVRNRSLPKTMERGFTPSTPADRAPRLPRTRAHATTKNAGSATRLKRSSNRRSGSSVAHWCSLVWIFSTRDSASKRSGHSASVFTDDLLIFQHLVCETTALLRHVRGFPTLGLLRGLRPTPTLSADAGPARHRPGGPGGREAPGWFPRSPLTVRRVRRPALPRQHRHEYAAGLPHGLLAGPVDRLRSRPGKPRPGVRCDPAHIHQVGAGSGLAGVRPLVSALVHLPVPLAGPGPSGSTDPSRRCRGCSHPPLRLQGRAAPSFSEPLRRLEGGVLSSPHGQTAPRGAPPASNRRRSPPSPPTSPAVGPASRPAPTAGRWWSRTRSPPRPGHRGRPASGRTPSRCLDAHPRTRTAPRSHPSPPTPSLVTHNPRARPDGGLVTKRLRCVLAATRRSARDPHVKLTTGSEAP